MAQLLRTEKLKLVNKIAGSEIVLFENLNLFIDEKEWVNISIPHGGGKTSLFKVLLSQSKPTSGRLIYNNKDKLDEYDKEKYIRENITAVSEYPSVIDEFTVKDWVRFQIEILRPKGVRKKLKEYYNILSENKVGLEKHLTQLRILDIRKMEILFSVLSDTILIICDDIDMGLTKDELDELADFLKVISKQKAIITISTNPIWSKYAKKVIRL